MESLSDMCMSVVAANVSNMVTGRYVHLLPPRMKTMLLERVLGKDLLTKDAWKFVVRKEYFHDLLELILPRSDQMDDRFMYAVANSGCKLRRIFLSVPMIPTDERRAKLTGRGVSALLGTQDALEALTLIWCVNFKAGVLNRVRSDSLRTVEICGDAMCSCFANSPNLVRDVDVQLYQREISFLAINNPTITRLYLDCVILNIEDCHSLLSALADSLEYLSVKAIRYYEYCELGHCFYGKDFLLFLETADTKCNRLQYLSCYCYRTDFQDLRQLRLKNERLQKLCLEGHVFEAPIILPSSLRKLKMSLKGHETMEHFAVLHSDYMPSLEKVYVHLIDEYILSNDGDLEGLFSLLGDKIVSVTNINVLAYKKYSMLISQYCPNLHSLGILRNNSANGTSLMSIFADSDRAGKLKHVSLPLVNGSQALLSLLAENCVSLRTLDLAYCATVDDAFLECMAKKCCYTLRTLDVTCCKNAGDHGVQAVAENCRELEEISMLGTKVADKGVSALARHCPKLRISRYEETGVEKSTVKILKDICKNRRFGGFGQC